MMKNTKILFILMIITVYSCEKRDNQIIDDNTDKENIEKNIYIKSVIMDLNYYLITDYIYNEDFKLIARETKIDNRLIEIFKFNFDEYNTLTHISYNYYQDGELVYSKENWMDFYYEDFKIVGTDKHAEGTRFYYSYNEFGQVHLIESDSQKEIIKYNSKGNIINKSKFTKQEMEWEIVYEYDIKKNPFYKLDPIVDLSINKLDLINYASPNNVIKAIKLDNNHDTIDITEIHYKYNEFDLPETSFEVFTSNILAYDHDTLHKKTYLY